MKRHTNGGGGLTAGGGGETSGGGGEAAGGGGEESGGGGEFAGGGLACTSIEAHDASLTYITDLNLPQETIRGKRRLSKYRGGTDCDIPLVGLVR